MERFIKLILISLGICSGCSKSGVISPHSFSEDVAAALRKASPGLKVEIVQDLQLKLTTTNGKESNCFLDNAYGLYKQDPKAKETVIRKYVESGLETLALTGSDKVDRNRIVAIVKDRPWVKEIRQSLSSSGRNMAESVYDDYNEDLVIVYAEDAPKSIRYLTPGQLADLGIERKDLRNLACENLKRLLPKVRQDQGDGFYQLSAGGDYDASLLLLDSVWGSIKKDVSGQIVIALPARNGLLVTGSENEKGLANVKQIVQKVYARDPYRITPKLFIRRAGKFEEFKQ
jgi:uncharacterized protein YtpQ (UPF0354 family)